MMAIQNSLLSFYEPFYELFLVTKDLKVLSFGHFSVKIHLDIRSVKCYNLYGMSLPTILWQYKFYQILQKRYV